MSDEEESDSPPRPMIDRSTEASAFKDRKPDEDAGPRHGKDLMREGFAQQNPQATTGSVLEGDSLWERFGPTIVSVIIVLIFLGMLAYYLLETGVFDSKAVSTAENEPEPTSYSLVSRPTVARNAVAMSPVNALIEDNTVQMGGYERLKRLSSVALRGTMMKGDRTYKFSLYAMRPNYYRLVYELGDGKQYIVGYDGKSAWEEYKQDGMTMNSRFMPPEQAELLRQNVDFDLPPQKYTLVSEYSVDRQTPIMEVNLLPRDIQGREIYDVVRIKEKGRPNVIAFIGTSDHLLHQTTAKVEDKELRTVYDQYKRFDGAFYPTYREQYLNDELVAKVWIESVEFAPGTMLNMFSPPTGTR